MSLTPRDNPTAIVRNFREFIKLRAVAYNYGFFIRLRSEHPEEEPYWDAIRKIEDRIRQEAYKETQEYVSRTARTDDPNKILSLMRRAGIIFREGHIYKPGCPHEDWEVFGDLADVPVPEQHQAAPSSMTVTVAVKQRRRASDVAVD